MGKTMARWSRAVIVLVAIAASLPAHATSLGWVNGDFELGDATWSYAPTATFADADDSGDLEVKLVGCADGDIQLARGVTKLDVPATTHLSFDVEQGGLTWYSFRMILASATNPQPWANNLLNADESLPTNDVNYWFDDQVLAWEGGAAPLTGHVDLDPLEAKAFNIDGWDDMSASQRSEFLGTAFHMTLVVYGCADGFNGGATLDNFAWEV